MLFRIIKEDNYRTVFWIIIAALLIAGLFLHFFDFTVPERKTPLLTHAEGLIATKQIAHAKSLNTKLLLPSETFGAEVELIGLYQKDNDHLPKQSIVTIYTKDQWRFIEIVQEPNGSLEQTKEHFFIEKETPIKVGENEGVLLQLDSFNTYCKKPHEDGHPGLCHISKMVLFEYKDHLFRIGVDGDHASEGELIAIARSMVE